MRIRVVVVVLAVLAGSLAVSTAGAQAASAKGPASCADAKLTPSSSHSAKLRTSTRCIVNAMRAQRGLRALTYHALLQTIAQRHCSYMLRRQVFTHQDAAGRGVARRAIANRYTARTRKFDVGEVLAFGANGGDTPIGIQDNWLRSTAHRALLFSRLFRDIGVGVSFGSPLPNPFARTSATYCVVVGVR